LIAADDAIFSETHDNLFDTVTASVRLTYTYFTYCPTGSPSQSRIPAASNTPPQSAVQPSQSPLPATTTQETLTPLPSDTAIETVSASRTWFCDVYEALMTSFTSSTPFCLEIRDSFFSGTHSDYGGGISIRSSSPSVTISDSTFRLCSATFGGAVDYSGSDLSVSRSCFYFTVASRYGTAIDLLSGSGSVSLSESNFVGCHNDLEQGCWGTIADDLGVDSVYRGTNFSFCALRSPEAFGEGSVLYARRDSGHWNFSFSTFLYCSGFSAIHNNCDQVCELSFSNVYNNVVPVDSGVVFCRSVGIVVESCIFNNNSAEFFLEHYSPGSGFRILHCMFSADLPNAVYFDQLVGNVANTETASLSLDHFDTFDCPAARPQAQTSTFTSFSLVYRKRGLFYRSVLFTFFVVTF
jgi:hypothetical protein